jgi:uncharacterized protein YjbJ (UPF0337 family)
MGELRPEKEVRMSGQTDEVKGRAKQAAGVVTGDKKLENEGKVDRAAGKVKKAVGKVADKAKDVLKGSR